MKRVDQLAIDISLFLMDKYREESDKIRPSLPPPFSEFTYAVAILKWEKMGKPNQDYFTVSNDEDLCFLHFRQVLSLKFGLVILTIEEAKYRKGKIKVITEADWLKEIGIINPFNK